MDYNSGNKNTGKRKAQSIQDMINSTPASGSGIKRSTYAGPKNAAASINSMNSGNSNTGRINLSGLSNVNAGTGKSYGGTTGRISPIGGTTGRINPVGGTTGRISPIGGVTADLSGINVNRSNDYDRWGNSNEGMPKPKKERYKADVANPMRGNVLKRDLEQSRNRLDKKAKSLEKSRKSQDRQVRDDYDFDDDIRDTRSSNNRRPANDGYVAPEYSGPIDAYGGAIYIGMLALCVIVTLIASGVKPRGSGYTYPMNVITISGVINTAYEHTMGINNAFGVSSMSSTTQAGTDGTSQVDENGNLKTVDLPDEGNLTDLGSDGEAATLDDGTMSFPGVEQATSHDELISQVQTALQAGNYSFISAKFAYEDESTGQLSAYPMSQIKHFCEYMYANQDKISPFISNVSSEEYSGKNGSAFLVKLPVMKFTVKMGTSSESFVLDNTVVSVSGFSDVIVNGNQNAAIYPLLPCMYTVTLTNNAWETPSQSQEIEATLGEGNLEIKVGQASE